MDHLLEAIRNTKDDELKSFLQARVQKIVSAAPPPKQQTAAAALQQADAAHRDANHKHDLAVANVKGYPRPCPSPSPRKRRLPRC